MPTHPVHGLDGFGAGKRIQFPFGGCLGHDASGNKAIRAGYKQFSFRAHYPALLSVTEQLNCANSGTIQFGSMSGVFDLCAMHVPLCVLFSAVVSRFWLLWNHYPTMKRWAIFIHPPGDE